MCQILGVNIRVQLINPPMTLSSKDYLEVGGSAPLGLAYLAAVLSEKGHDVRIIDCLGLSPLPVQISGDSARCGMEDTEILRRVEEFEPDIIGISCHYTATAGDAVGVAELVRRKYSDDVPVVLGGAHASICPAELLKSPFVDFVVAGEGELTIVELCSVIESGADATVVPGVCTKGPVGEVVKAPARSRITDLDSIPFPRRDLLPLGEYTRQQERFRGGINNMRIPFETIITSRGCPENCVFCASCETWGRKWVGRSPENVVAEIELLKSEYGIKEIAFLDDSISVSRKRLRQLCELMIDRKLGMKWCTPSGIAIWTLDRDLLKVMKKAGCYRLTFGLESGDPDTIAFIHKRYEFNQALEIIKTANRMGVWTVATFVIGFPYESREQIGSTIEFAKRSNVDLAFFYSATPFPGTELYDICAKEGIEVPETSNLMLTSPGSLHLSPEEICRVREEANDIFMRSLRRRPWRVLGKIRNLEDLRFVLRVGRYSMRLFRSRAEDRSTTSFLYSARKR